MFGVVCWLVPNRASAEELSGIYEKSGAGELYDSLDEETQELLSQGGVEDASWEGEDSGGLFEAFSQLFREKLTAPLKGLAALLGVNYTAGLPIVRTSPAHGTAYDIAGQGVALEDSFRQAIYVAMDVFRNRVVEKEIHAHPLRKQYYEKRDDSDKLKLDTIDDED